MLEAAFQFIAFEVVLLRPELGWRDAVFSTLIAAAMSLFVSAVFCAPAVLRVTAIGPLKTYFISYIVGFSTGTLIVHALTTTFLGWPRDESYSLSLSETVSWGNPPDPVGRAISGVRYRHSRRDIVAHSERSPSECLMKPFRLWVTASPSGQKAKPRALRLQP